MREPQFFYRESDQIWKVQRTDWVRQLKARRGGLR